MSIALEMSETPENGLDKRAETMEIFSQIFALFSTEMVELCPIMFADLVFRSCDAPPKLLLSNRTYALSPLGMKIEVMLFA